MLIINANYFSLQIYHIFWGFFFNFVIIANPASIQEKIEQNFPSLILSQADPTHCLRFSHNTPSAHKHSRFHGKAIKNSSFFLILK